jgi:hypothetical protein
MQGIYHRPIIFPRHSIISALSKTLKRPVSARTIGCDICKTRHILF